MPSQLTDDVLAEESVRKGLSDLFTHIPHKPRTQYYETAVQTITAFTERMVEIASCARLPKATKKFSAARSEAAARFRSEQQPAIDKLIATYQGELSRQGLPRDLALEPLAREVMTQTLRRL